MIEDLKKWLKEQVMILEWSCNYETIGTFIYKEVLNKIEELEKEYNKYDQMVINFNNNNF